MDIRDQLKNLFPEHEEQDFEMPEEKFEQNEPLICKFEKKGRNGRYYKTNKLLKELRPIFEADGFFVYNCNPESKCDAFDYVPFEKAYLDCKGGVPPEPFDLSQWYEKTIAEGHILQNPESMSYEEVHNHLLKKQ